MESNADAGGHRKRMLAEHMGRGQGAQQPDDGAFAFAHVAQSPEQHDEFVAAQPRHRIAATHAGTQAFGDGDQQSVADGVAEGIVDLLESVEIKVADRE